MKQAIFFLLALLMLAGGVHAQPAKAVQQKSIPELYMGRDVSLHFISPEPIRYVDISTHAIGGDLPIPNILRIKAIPDTSGSGSANRSDAAVVTIVGESFIAQYRLRYGDFPPSGGVAPLVNILPEHTRPLEVPGVTLTTKQMREFAVKMLSRSTGRALRSAKAYGVKAMLDNICTIGDYVFLDITYNNSTNLPYQIDEQRFKIEDKKIVKATNSQSVEIKPVFKLYHTSGFRKQYRNIYAFKKVTFPGSKVLRVELTEKQLSGRMITLEIKYRDVLNADTF